MLALQLCGTVTTPFPKPPETDARPVEFHDEGRSPDTYVWRPTLAGNSRMRDGPARARGSSGGVAMPVGSRVPASDSSRRPGGGASPC